MPGQRAEQHLDLMNHRVQVKRLGDQVAEASRLGDIEVVRVSREEGDGRQAGTADHVGRADERRAGQRAEAVSDHQVEVHLIKVPHRLHRRHTGSDRVAFMLKNVHDQVADRGVIFNQEDVSRQDWSH